MQSKLKLDHQTQAVAMATGGAAIAAIAAMFVPTGIWETLTGSTGVSEMIPATAAPLGDTARALISFAFGALRAGGTPTGRPAALCRSALPRNERGARR